MKPEIVYGLYKGDKFIDVGTVQELAQKLNVKKETILFLASPGHLRRAGPNTKVAVKVEMESEEERQECVILKNISLFVQLINTATGLRIEFMRVV